MWLLAIELRMSRPIKEVDKNGLFLGEDGIGKAVCGCVRNGTVSLRSFVSFLLLDFCCCFCVGYENEVKNEELKENGYAVGDEVWIERPPKKGQSKKFHLRYEGPYKIVEKKGCVNCRVEGDLDGEKLLVNAGQMKPVIALVTGNGGRVFKPKREEGDVLCDKQ